MGWFMLKCISMHDLDWFVKKIGETVTMQGKYASVEKVVTDYHTAERFYNMQPHYTFSVIHRSERVCLSCEG